MTRAGLEPATKGLRVPLLVPQESQVKHWHKSSMTNLAMANNPDYSSCTFQAQLSVVIGHFL
jgi:hypothetical protein